MRVTALGLVVGAAMAYGAPPPHVTTIEHDGSSYARRIGGSSNLAPRQAVAQRFFQTHADQYDFLIVFPTFAADFGAEVGGIHFDVGNDVQGIGLPLGSSASSFGSSGRLKGYIDIAALMPNGSTDLGSIEGVAMHELAHQWSGRARVLLPSSAVASDEILDGEGHWSFFLDSNASVLYGADWQQVTSGSFEAMGSRKRLSELDLYLMGFMSPLEVPTQTLLRGTGHARDELPPPDGTVIQATAVPFSIDAIIAANGQRVPSSQTSQKRFRAAFIILTAPGTNPTPAQLATVEAARRQLSNEFFFQTRGRGVMETELVELPAGPVSSNPSIQSGLAALLAMQRADGSWADTRATSTRETAAALETLAAFLTQTSVPSAQARGANWLSARSIQSVDGASRAISALTASMRPANSGTLEVLRNPQGTFGATPGYQPTIIDSALALDALLDVQTSPTTLAPLVDWLFAQQNADGGWPLLLAGPSRIEATSLVVTSARRLPALSNARAQAITRAIAFLRAHQRSDGSFSDDVKSAAATAHAVQALSAWQQLTPAEAASATAFLFSQQLVDGSWLGSAYQTAEALKGLRAALSANLTLLASDITLSSNNVAVGEPVSAQVTVRNTGLSTTPVSLQAFDSNGTPLSAIQTSAPVAPGSVATFNIQLDTTGHASSSQVFFVADPQGTLEETREDDNRASLSLLIRPASVLPDLFVAQGSLSTSPPALRGPTSLVVSGTVGNAGLTAVTTAVVSLRINGVEVATTVVDLAAQSQQVVSLSANVTATGAAVVELFIDPTDAFVENVESNNTARLTVPVLQVVDLRVASLSISAPSVMQGADVGITVTLENVGTVGATATAVVEIQNGSGTLVTVPVAGGARLPGQSLVRTVQWRANVAGSLTVAASVSTSGDVDSSNDSLSVPLVVSASALANLTSRTSDCSISPDPPLEGQGATASSIVRNVGGATTSPFDVAVYLGNPGAGGTLLARSTIPGLGAGAQTTVTASVPTVGNVPLEIVTVVDEANAVAEFDEDDNSSVVTWTPARFADLVVTSADIRPTPLFPRSGDPVSVVVSVFNAGGQTAAQVRVALTGTSGTGYGTQTVTVAPQSRAETTFALTNLVGSTTLTAEINGDRAVTEGRYDNNSASRTITLQSATLALSNPYFSPNGDGIKDTTEILAQPGQGEHLEFEVFDRAGNRVRAASAASNWDGTDDRGRVVADDTYRVDAWSVGATRTLVGSVQASVDTNRLLVTRTVGTPFFINDASARGTPTSDDLKTMYLGTEPTIFGVQRPGIFLREFGGGAQSTRLTPSAWSQSQIGGEPSPSPDGRSFTNAAFDPGSGQNVVRIYDWVSGTNRVLASGATGQPIFDRTGRVILALISTASGYQLEVIDAVSGSRRVLVSFFWTTPSEYRFSPDGRSVSYTLNNDVFVVPTSGGVPTAVPFAALTGVVDWQSGYQPASPRYAWRPTSDRIAYVSAGTTTHITDSTECYRIVYANDPEYSPPSDCYVGVGGGLREIQLGTFIDTQLFVDPGYSMPAQGGSIVASPSGDSIVFPYETLSTLPAIRSLGYLSALENGSVFRVNNLFQENPTAWSPGGTFVVTSGGAVGSDANGRVRVSAARTPGGGSLTLSGNATDWNFDEYELSVRLVGTSAWTVLKRANQNVRNSKFMDWTPSSPGRWEISVVVRDKAGNSRSATTQAGWSTSPAISSLTLDPALFSPNGDSAKDTTSIGYFVNAPITSEFRVSNSAGDLVRTFARTDLVPGTQSFVWDGRNDQGVVAPDGTYVLEVEGLSASVTVDDTPPQVNLVMGDGVSTQPFSARTRLVDFRNALGLPGLPHPIPVVEAQLTWSASDLHFAGWELQLGDQPDDFLLATVQTGISQAQLHDWFALREVAAGFRLRASDAADNRAVSQTIQIPERFFVVAIGNAESLSAQPGAVVIDGVTEPRVDTLLPHYKPGGLTEFDRNALEPERHAFLFDSNLRERIVAYSVSYSHPGGPSIVDTTNVSMLSPHVLVWDARLVARGDYDVQVCATDATGRQFCDLVTYRATAGATTYCVRPAGARARLEAEIANEWGNDPVEVVAVGQTTALAAAVPGPTRRISFELPAGGCQYRLRNSVTGATTETIDSCGLHFANLSMAPDGTFEADLEETFDEDIVRARVSVGGQWVSVGGFSGWTHVRALLPVACNVPLGNMNYSVELATGAAISGSVSEDDGIRTSRQPSNGRTEFASCLEVSQFTRSCATPTLSLGASRSGNATCSLANPDVELTAEAQAVSGESVVALTLGYDDEQRRRFELASIAPGTRDAGIATTLRTDALAEGEYELFAELIQSNGVSRAERKALTVDRSAPSVSIESPRAGERVCAIPASRGFVLRASGRLLDAHADTARFRLLSSSGEALMQSLSGPPDVAAQTRLDVGGDYELVLEGSDTAGNSSCTSVSFHYVAPVELHGWSSSLQILSPDGDGQFEQTNLMFELSEPAAVTVTARATSGGAPRTVLQVSAGAGVSTIPWSGRDTTGALLSDGDYELEISAVDECALTTSATAYVRIDTTAPIARLDAPTPNQSVRGTLAVSGEASDVSFERYELRILSGTTATNLSADTTARTGPFGTFPLSAFGAGSYDVELFVTDRAGHSAVATQTVVIGSSRLLSDVVGPLFLSPNGDGQLDQGTLSWRLEAPAAVVVELIHSGGAETVAARTTANGAQTLTVDAALLGARPEGQYALRVTASDSTGTESEQVPLIIDVTPPSIVVRSPAAGAAVPGTATVVAQIVDANPVTWSFDGPNANHRDGNSNIDGVLAQLTALPEGANSFEVAAVDVAGNAARTRVSFASDTIAPVVDVSQPVAGAFLSGLDGGIAVRGTVVEQDLASVALTSGTTTVFTGSTLPPQIPWDVSAETDGPAELVLSARDRAGNEGRARVSVVIDNTRPVAAIASPRSDVLHSGEFVGSASDLNFANYRLEIAAQGQQFFMVGEFTTPVVNGSLARLLTAPTDGPYTARLTATDRAGNVSVDTTTFVIDLTPPDAVVLTATRTGPSSTHLSWATSSSPDVTSYVVVDALGATVAELSTAATSIDLAGLVDGTHQLTVLAVDAAGLRSVPSNSVPFIADSTPPLVVIASPRAGARVRGNTSINGTVLADDLAEYRLRVGPGLTPATFTTFFTATSEVPAGSLGLLDTSTLMQGGTYTLRLEADDDFGNTAAAQETFVVDDVAPAAPVLLSATPSGSNVNVVWQLNAEPDVIGYLVYRNFQLVNGPASSVSDPTPYLLPPDQNTWFASNIPDGTHRFLVQAVDAAGNVSPFSNELLVTINLRAPVASIVSPVSLARTTQALTLVADSADEDVASMRLEARGGGGAWVTLANLSSPPWTAPLNPSSFANPIEVRATATDTFGASDPAPVPLAFFFAPPITPPALARLVDGTSVNLSWTDSNSAGTVAGYGLRRDGASLVSSTRPVGTFTATSGIPANAWDGSSSTVWRVTSFPQTWQITFNSPALLSQLGVGFLTSPTWDLEVLVNGTWVGVLRRASGAKDAPLGGTLRVEGIRVTVFADPFGRTDMWEVIPTVVPALPASTSTFASSGNTFASHSFVVEATSAYGAVAASSAQANIYVPVLGALPAATPDAAIAVQGSNTRPGDDVQLSVGASVVAHATADANGRFTAQVALSPGVNAISALAVAPNGDRSVRSAVSNVTRATAPTANVALVLDAVVGSTVSLSYTVNGDTSGVTGFVISRTGGSQSTVVGTVGAGQRTFDDTNVPNGSWRYAVAAINLNQLAGPQSNEVDALVDVAVAAPTNLVVSASPAGRALELTWASAGSPAGGFIVERAASATGPFTQLANSVTTSTLIDSNLPEASTWWYRVFARDARGSTSASSNVAQGTVHDSIRPEAPIITAPTVAGSPITTSSATSTVSGLAEPNATVMLRNDGVTVGTRAAGALAFIRTPFNNASPWWSAVAGSPRGDVAAWTSYVSAPSVVLGAPGTVERVIDTNGNYPGRLRFSPDGAHLAFELQLQTGQRVIAVIDVPSGSLTRLLPPSGAEELSPIWSSDSRELFFALSAPPALPVIARSEVGSGTYRVVGASPLDSPQPIVVANGEVFVAGWDQTVFMMGVAALDLGTGSSRAVFSLPNGISQFGEAIPGQATFAFSDGYPNVVVVDLITGAQRELGAGSALGLSPDGKQVLSSSYPNLFVTPASGGAALQLSSNFQSNLAAWLGSGVVVGENNQQLSAIRWGGRFEFPNVPLHVGANVFTAEAQDEGGNVSPRSQSIRVTRDASLDPDLAVSLDFLPSVPVATRPASLLVTVRNLGTGTAPATTVSAVVVAADGSSQFPPNVAVPSLAQGQSVRLSMPFNAAALSGPGNTAQVEVDSAGAIADVDRSNNVAVATFTVAATTDVALTLAVTPSQVGAFEAFGTTTELYNPGASRTLSLHLFVVAADGSTARDIDTVPLGVVGSAARLTVTRAAISDALAPGSYEVVAEALEGSTVAARVTSALVITPERSAAIRLTTSRARYFEGETVGATAIVTNRSRNASLDSATVAWRLSDATGLLTSSGTVAIPMLAIGSSTTVSFAVGAPRPGVWTLEADVTDGTTTLATTTSAFAVDGRALLSGTLSVPGALSTPITVAAGDPLLIDLSVANGGSADATSVQASIALVDPAATTTGLRAFPLGSLSSGTSTTRTAQFDTTGLHGTWLATLVLNADGIGAFEAARLQVRITDGVSPELIVLSPLDGSLVGGAPTLRAEARDATGVALVRAELDGLMQSLSAFAGSPWNGEWRLTASGLADGPHTAVFSAADTEGNDGLVRPNGSNPVSITFTVDSTPPVISIVGVVDGQLGNTIVVPQISVSDAHPGVVQMTLNGSPYASGTPIDADGHWVLEVLATDAAGNRSQQRVEFDVDRTPPLIAAFGFVEGSFVRTDIRPGFTVTDAHAVNSAATLDGAPFVSGSVVSAEGLHLLRVVAQDSAGNGSTFAATFTIDRTAPALALTGFSPGELTARTVIPGVTATDPNLLALERRIDGVRTSAGTQVNTEGDHTFTADALDRAGNTASISGSFTIDLTPPTITVTGVSDGQVSSAPLRPTVSVTDAHFGTSSISLDGANFVSGTLVSTAGAHVLQVSATDLAGNTSNRTVTFELARTTPLVVSWSGFLENAIVQGPVAPVLNVTGTATSVSATLDGAPFVSGTSVSSEGAHSVDGTAVDAFGSVSATGHFTIDLTAPRITIAGVTNGQVGSAPVTPSISVAELHPGSVSITLNGAPFTSGTTVANAGTYSLRVDAVDVAGNAASTSVQFTIQQAQSVTIDRTPLSDFPRVLALLEASGCRSSNHSRIAQALRDALGPDSILRTTSSRPSFLNDLRSGAFNTYVVVSTGCDHEHHDGDGCDDDDDDDWYGASISNWNSSAVIRARIGSELSEQVFGGHAGLVVVSAADSDLDLRAVTGLTTRPANARTVQFINASPIAGSAALTLNAPLRSLTLSGATAAATYSGPSQLIAAATSTAGLGRTVTYGFDPADGVPLSSATLSLSRALTWVRPPLPAPQALLVSGVRVDTANPTSAAFSETVTELLTPPMRSLDSLPTARLSNFGSTLEWQSNVPAGQTKSFRYWSRLPDAAGTWPTTTQVRIGSVLTSRSDAFSTTLSGAALLANAQAGAVALPNGARRTSILAALSRVQSRAVRQRADLDTNIADLLGAAADADAIGSAAAAQVRQRIDHLIVYWEARWYVY